MDSRRETERRGALGPSGAAGGGGPGPVRAGRVWEPALLRDRSCCRLPKTLPGSAPPGLVRVKGRVGETEVLVVSSPEEEAPEEETSRGSVALFMQSCEVLMGYGDSGVLWGSGVRGIGRSLCVMTRRVAYLSE